MTIQKTFTTEIDTDRERTHIKKAFRDNPTAKKNLLKLMDLIEAEKWDDADKLLMGKWFRGNDEKLECSRREFVGMLYRTANVPDGFDAWATYIDLVNAFIFHKDNYRVVSKSFNV